MSYIIEVELINHGQSVELYRGKVCYDNNDVNSLKRLATHVAKNYIEHNKQDRFIHIVAKIYDSFTEEMMWSKIYYHIENKTHTSDWHRF